MSAGNRNRDQQRAGRRSTAAWRIYKIWGY